MKFLILHTEVFQLMSRPARALWIEIGTNISTTPTDMSRPARALWIEIDLKAKIASLNAVEAREGLVD